MVFRAESTESVSSEVDDMYGECTVWLTQPRGGL